jgi:hypothetical protein
LFRQPVELLGRVLQKNARTDRDHDERDENDAHGDQQTGSQRHIFEGEQIHPIWSLAGVRDYCGGMNLLEHSRWVVIFRVLSFECGV